MQQTKIGVNNISFRSGQLTPASLRLHPPIITVPVPVNLLSYPYSFLLRRVLWLNVLNSIPHQAKHVPHTRTSRHKARYNLSQPPPPRPTQAKTKQKRETKRSRRKFTQTQTPQQTQLLHSKSVNVPSPSSDPRKTLLFHIACIRIVTVKFRDLEYKIAHINPSMANGNTMVGFR